MATRITTVANTTKTLDNADIPLLRRWFDNPRNNDWVQLVTAITWGVVLSPWGKGIFFLVIVAVIYELLYRIMLGEKYHGQPIRGAIICGSILGWIVGRTACGKPVLEEGVWPEDERKNN